MKRPSVYLLLLLWAVAPATLEAKPTSTTKKPLSPQEVEFAFIDHFKKADFKQVDAVPVVHGKGELVTSGMAPFKEFLLGNKRLNGDLLFAVQPCIRAHGAQNDAVRVKSSDQHLSYFEALSFLAPEEFLESIVDLVHAFLTKILSIEKDRIFVTIHEGDEKAFNAWLRYLSKDHIFRMGKDTNYWQDEKDPRIHGKSTEIFLDNRSREQRRATPPTKKDFKTGNMLEITNIVSSTVTPPPAMPHTITPPPYGMMFKGGSIQRFAAAQPHAPVVFENAQIAPITKKVETLTGITYRNCRPKNQSCYQNGGRQHPNSRGTYCRRRQNIRPN
jgi:alanyl-tRNA synthetase